MLDAQFFGVLQARKRIYIVGTFKDYPDLKHFNPSTKKLGEELERGLPTESSKFIDNFLAHYSVAELEGRSIKDKRGEDNNIHSRDLEIHGAVSQEQNLC